MKFTIEHNKIRNALDKTAGAVERKSPQPILSNTLLQASVSQLTVTTTNMNIELVVVLDNIDVESTGTSIINAKNLQDIVKVANNEDMIIFDESNDRATIRYGRSRFNLSTLSSETFPTLDTVEFDTTIHMVEKDFAALLSKVTVTMGTDDVRYYLNGMLFEFSDDTLKCVSTDGHRLSFATRHIDAANSVINVDKIIVPRQSINEMTRLLDKTSIEMIELQISKKHIRIKKHDIQMTSKLIDSNYPDYHMAIPKTFAHSLTINRDTLRLAIIRASILLTDQCKALMFTLDNNTLRLHSDNSANESSDERLDIDYQKEPFEIGYNATYLLGALNSLDDEFIILNMNNETLSTEIYSVDDLDSRYYVMPVKI